MIASPPSENPNMVLLVGLPELAMIARKTAVGGTFRNNSEIFWCEIVDLAEFRFEIFNETRVTGDIFRTMVHAPKANPPRRDTKRIHMPSIIPTLPNQPLQNEKRGHCTWHLGSRIASKKSSIRIVMSGYLSYSAIIHLSGSISRSIKSRNSRAYLSCSMTGYY
jgi:hypothetical protein